MSLFSTDNFSSGSTSGVVTAQNPPTLIRLFDTERTVTPPFIKELTSSYVNLPNFAKLINSTPFQESRRKAQPPQTASRSSSYNLHELKTSDPKFLYQLKQKTFSVGSHLSKKKPKSLGSSLAVLPKSRFLPGSQNDSNL